MATTLIEQGATCGAMGGMLFNRQPGLLTAAGYATLAAAAESIADECVALAAGVALADADNAEMVAIVANVAFALCASKTFTSTTDADYAGLAGQIVAASKAVANVII